MAKDEGKNSKSNNTTTIATAAVIITIILAATVITTTAMNSRLGMPWQGMMGQETVNGFGTGMMGQGMMRNWNGNSANIGQGMMQGQGGMMQGMQQMMEGMDEDEINEMKEHCPMMKQLQ